MNTCFLCLENSSIKRCPHCNTYAHHVCWKQYIDNTRPLKCEVVTITTKDSIKYTNTMIEPISAECPICRQDIPISQRITRSQTTKATFIEFKLVIDAFLRRFDIANGNVEKFYILNKMYKYMHKRKKVWKETVFRDVIQKKLVEFHDHGWEDASYHHQRLFNSPL